MLAHVVRLSLVLELAAYAALGGWLHAERAWPVAALVPLAIAAALAARFGMVCFSSSLAWLNRSPRPPEYRIGLAGVPRYLLGEYRALLADNLFYLPWKFALRPDPAAQPGAGVPIILVHGYFSNRGYFRYLARWLEEQGHGPVFAPNFPVVLSSIEAFAAKLHREIERIATGCAQERVILICHSMGGLAAREYLRTHGDGRVARLITIASPHHGTALAALGLGANARQMCRGCEFLASLEAFEAKGSARVSTVSIYSLHDNLVAPQETSRLPWARNVTLFGLGHLTIIDAPATFAALREALAS
jgi:triacylglycerol esterase/lipase EstA (alpha/beta hydrolase family)